MVHQRLPWNLPWCLPRFCLDNRLGLNTLMDHTWETLSFIKHNRLFFSADHMVECKSQMLRFYNGQESSFCKRGNHNQSEKQDRNIALGPACLNSPTLEHAFMPSVTFCQDQRFTEKDDNFNFATILYNQSFGLVLIMAFIWVTRVWSLIYNPCPCQTYVQAESC